MSKRVTITDLARITGFSKTTISHVVNNTAGARIRPETREMILKAAREHNYVPNFFARNIIRGRTRFLGFLTYSLDDACRSGELLGAEEACREADCYLMIFNAGEQPQAESNLIEDLVQRGIEGLYASHLDSPGEAQDRLSQFDIDLVLGQHVDGEIAADCFFDQMGMGYHKLCDALRGHGHTWVGFVAPNRGERDPQREIARQIFREHDIGFDEYAVDSPEAMQALPWIQHREHAPTAIVCFYTRLCLSVMAQLGFAGRHVPEDVSVVLVDSIRPLGVEMPQIAQLQWRSHDKGKMAIQRLVKRLYDESERGVPYSCEGLEPYLHMGASLGHAREHVSA